MLSTVQCVLVGLVVAVALAISITSMVLVTNQAVYINTLYSRVATLEGTSSNTTNVTNDFAVALSELNVTCTDLTGDLLNLAIFVNNSFGDLPNLGQQAGQATPTGWGNASTWNWVLETEDSIVLNIFTLTAPGPACLSESSFSAHHL